MEATQRWSAALNGRLCITINFDIMISATATYFVRVHQATFLSKNARYIGHALSTFNFPLVDRSINMAFHVVISAM